MSLLKGLIIATWILELANNVHHSVSRFISTVFSKGISQDGFDFTLQEKYFTLQEIQNEIILLDIE